MRPLSFSLPLRRFHAPALGSLAVCYALAVMVDVVHGAALFAARSLASAVRCASNSALVAS